MMSAVFFHTQSLWEAMISQELNQIPGSGLLWQSQLTQKAANFIYKSFFYKTLLTKALFRKGVWGQIFIWNE